MISLTCTNCRTLLEIDDAFAGGVCRCQHCGAIQTVPSHLKKRQELAAAAAKSSNKKAKTLYSRTGAHGGGGGGGDTGPSSGLDELAHVVASSGLSSGRLRAKTVALNKKSGTQSQTPLVIAVAALAVAVIGVGLFFAMRGAPAAPTQAGSSGPGTPTVAVAPTKATVSPSAAAGNFCGVALTERAVVYVLDRGSGTADLFSYLKEAALRSAQSLGTERKFKLIFWNNGSDDAFPAGNPTFATIPNIESARRALDGIFASGQTDVGSALAQAVNNKPDVIVLATGKGWQLDDSFVEQVMKIRGDRAIKIHTFTLGGTEASPALRTIAQRTGGQSVLVSEADIKQAASQ